MWFRLYTGRYNYSRPRHLFVSCHGGEERKNNYDERISQGAQGPRKNESASVLWEANDEMKLFQARDVGCHGLVYGWRTEVSWTSRTMQSETWETVFTRVGIYICWLVTLHEGPVIDAWLHSRFMKMSSITKRVSWLWIFLNFHICFSTMHLRSRNVSGEVFPVNECRHNYAYSL